MLKISHISKTFNPGTVNEKKAIEDLSLELKQGDFATIIGSNGAGKSTLMKILGGIYQKDKDSGKILIDHWLQWRWKVHVIQCNLRRFPDRYRLDRTR